MNIVEAQAKEFVEELYEQEHLNTLSNLKSLLSGKLLDFYKDQDKLLFLRILLNETDDSIKEHKKNCKGGACRFDEERELGRFLIIQELDEINKYLEPDHKDKFTTDEEGSLHDKINDIIAELNKIGLGQEIIFNEIDSLKDHFNLGKKNWFQLLKGKIVDLTIEKAIDQTLAKEVYSKLSDGFHDIVKQLNS